MTWLQFSACLREGEQLVFLTRSSLFKNFTVSYFNIFVYFYTEHLQSAQTL